MARLIVEAVRNDNDMTAPLSTAQSPKLPLLVSVSDAASGDPVHKLQAKNFAVTFFGLTLPHPWILQWTVAELESIPDTQPSGVYRLTLQFINPEPVKVVLGDQPQPGFEAGKNYSFGIHVRRTVRGVRGGDDVGQTVVSVMGYGQQVHVF